MEGQRLTPERTHGKSPEEHGRIVREGYDRIAEEYNKQREAFDNSKEIQEFIDRLPEGAVVLDVGCGCGVPVLKKLLSEGYTAKGIDFSQGMLEVARRNVPEAELVHEDILKVEFQPSSFDGIISTYAIIHIHKSQHSLVYKKIYEWLKPGGVMLVGTSWSEWEEIQDYYGVPMAWSHPAPKESLRMVKDTGFEVIFDKLVTTNDETVYWILARK